MQQIIGQEFNLNIINRWDNLPNFIIIQGDKHTGKSFLAKWLCRKFKIDYVEMKNNIDSIRSLLNIMSADANVVYHFKDFDTASAQAKNALLKVTEETPKGNYIIITGSHQIPTLESRARKIVMSSYTKNDMIDFISKYFTPDKAINYYKAGFNTPSKVLLYKEYEGIDDLLNYAYVIFDNLSILNIDMIIYMLSRFEAKYDKIDATLLFLDMLIHIINYKSKYELGCRYSFKNVLQELIECKTKIEKEPVINRKLILYITFYNIMAMGGNL